MDTASISEVKNGLSAYLDRVKAGETILVTDRGVPVAVIEPVTQLRDPDARLLLLERQGLVRRGSGPIPDELVRARGPQLADGVSLVDILLDERESGW